MSTGTDRYGNAKATLRENVKWLAGSFAGLAGLILAGAPFTSLGELTPTKLRFLLATMSLVIALVCMFLAWRRLLRALRPDPVYNTCLRSNFNSKDVEDRYERTELEALKREFDLRYRDLLPEGVSTFEGLEDIFRKSWQRYKTDEQDAGARQQYEDYQTNLLNVQNWAGYTRLHQRVTREMREIGGLGAIVVAALIMFAWAANPGRAPAATAPSTIALFENRGVDRPDAARDTPPSLAPVRFGLGASALTPEGLAAVAGARDFLRRRPDWGLLLLAHTDTSGEPAANERLARRRADVVRRALIKEGGIAGDRVYVAAFSEEDLAVLTPQGTPHGDNRIVELPPR